MDALQLIEKATNAIELAALVSSEAAIKSTLDEAMSDLHEALRMMKRG